MPLVVPKNSLLSSPAKWKNCPYIFVLPFCFKQGHFGLFTSFLIFSPLAAHINSLYIILKKNIWDFLQGVVFKSTDPCWTEPEDCLFDLCCETCEGALDGVLVRDPSAETSGQETSKGDAEQTVVRRIRRRVGDQRHMEEDRVCCCCLHTFVDKLIHIFYITL